MTLLRRVLGETLRGQRLRQRRTLREVSGAARVSLGYLSEVERGQKEASSELLASICEALDVRLSEILRQVSDNLRRTERMADVARAPARQLVPAGAGAAPTPLPFGGDGAGFGVGLDLPADLDSAAAGGGGDQDRSDADGMTARFDGGPADPDRLDPDRLDPGRLDADRLDPDRLADRGDAEPLGRDPDRPNGPDLAGPDLDGPALDDAALDDPDLDDPDLDDPDRAGLDRSGLDGVDLAELETGDGFADVDALLSLTDLSCCLAEAHDEPRCLAGAVAAA